MDPIISRFKELDFAVDTSERLKFLDRGDTNNESDEEHDVRESSAKSSSLNLDIMGSITWLDSMCYNIMGGFC